MFKLFAKPGNIDLAERITVSRSNLVGATGLSRAAIARLVTSDGLFGRDSSFDAIEQQVVLEQLGWLTFPPPAASGDALRLVALQTLVACAVAGEGSVSGDEWNHAGEFGLSLAQRSEVLAVVGLSLATIGLNRVTNCGDAGDTVRIGAVAFRPMAVLSRAA